ncbi:MAG TPA: hypothetical protein VGM19_11550 [Armatimonadota bacterium]|jgi:hypothetical protein
MPRYLCLLLVVAALLAGVSLASAAGGPVVAMINAEADTWRADFLGYNQFRADLVKQGMNADLITYPFRPADLSQFHALLYELREEFQLGALDDPRVQAQIAAERATLEAYVKSGGGLVLLLTGVRYPQDPCEQYYNQVFAGMGIKLMHEGIWDPATAFKAPGTLAYAAQDFFTTTNLKPHAVTQGVTRLAFPKFTHSQLTGAEAVAYDNNWQVLVSGEPTAKSFFVDPISNEMNDQQPATYTTAPPLVAVRQFGLGRIFTYAIPPIYSTLNWNNPLWPQVAEKNGNVAANQPSQGHQLLVNALRWVCEPALQVPTLGGRQIPTTAPPIVWPAELQIPRPPGSPATGQPGTPAAPQRGIIGVHTSYSDGKGTPADYAQAALAAGLKFVIFSEALESLTPEKWQALVKDCETIRAQGQIYACPGYEYSDTSGLRWAMWGERVIYPLEKDWGPDGKSIFRDGDLEGQCNYPAKMLLNYDQLPGDPANLWWFYRLPIFVYDGGQLVADNRAQYQFALQDARLLPVACFTRTRSPREVATAAGLCTLNFPAGVNLRDELNTRCCSYNSPSFVSQGGAAGPQIEVFSVSNSQADSNLYKTAGTQRARVYFRVYSPVGLREVVVTDGTQGPARRYLLSGARDFSHEFAINHDRQHELSLEVTDNQGRRAVWSQIRLYSYKQGLYRCGDNLNMLGSTPVLCHPDRHELPHFPVFENWNLLTVQGFDTGAGVLTQPSGHLGTWELYTKAGSQGIFYGPKLPGDSGFRGLQMPTRMPMSSMEVSLWDVKNERTVRWPLAEVVLGPFLPVDKDLPYATREVRDYLLRSRLDYFTTWDHRRPHEGAEAYQGDVLLHTGVIKFKQDATLSGTLPISLDKVWVKGGSAYGIADTFMFSNPDLSPRVIKIGPDDRVEYSGDLPRGGFLTAGPTDIGVDVFLPVSNNLRFNTYTSSTGATKLDYTYFLGTGRDGQQVKAGEEIRYAYLTIALPSKVPATPENLTKIAQSFGLQPGGYPTVKTDFGAPEATEVFYSAAAQNHEYQATFGPGPMILNRPFWIDGLENNGTAAVYLLEGDPLLARFRFIPVQDGAGLFQQNLDKGGKLWVGNMFLADNPQLKLTPVLNGLNADEKPFLEIHNPTDQEITATITSPPHTPKFAGFTKKVTVPAGSDLRVPL